MPNVRNKRKNDIHVITKVGNFTLTAEKVTLVDDEAWKAATEPKAGVGLAEALEDKSVEVSKESAEQASPLPDGPLPEGSTPAQVAAAAKGEKPYLAPQTAGMAPAAPATAGTHPPTHTPETETDPYRKSKR